MIERLRALGITGAFLSVTMLFFAWGFICSNNDPLIVALRAAFRLSYTEALLTQLRDLDAVTKKHGFLESAFA